MQYLIILVFLLLIPFFVLLQICSVFHLRELVDKPTSLQHWLFQQNSFLSQMYPLLFVVRVWFQIHKVVQLLVLVGLVVLQVLVVLEVLCVLMVQGALGSLISWCSRVSRWTGWARWSSSLWSSSLWSYRKWS